MKRCRQCILTEYLPGVHFNNDGVCNYCTAQGCDDAKVTCQHLQNELQVFLKSYSSQGEYDCIVAFSGGKDSTYTLMMLSQHYRLRCLPVLIDNGFISPQAKDNCTRVVRALGVDFITYTPSSQFTRRIYQKSALHSDLHAKAARRRASDLCNSCIQLINNYVIKVALQNHVTLIAGGYIAGQVPKHSVLISLDLARQAKQRSAQLKRYEKYFGDESKKYYGIPQSGQNQSLHIINPMLTVNLSDEAIIEAVAPLGWQRVDNTGKHSSNCMLNDLGIVIHQKKYGFHPYIFEIAEKVRSGVLAREEAIAQISSMPSPGDVQGLSRRIGVDLSDI